MDGTGSTVEAGFPFFPDEPMQASQRVRQKLALVIGNLIRRCIEEARRIPYVLDQEQIVDILVGDPAFFAKLVQDEHHDRTEFSSERLTAKLDALTELGQFEAIDTFDVSFSRPVESDADLDPVLDLVNRLTRTFVVYVGNMVTIFEKEFQLLMERFRQSLQQGEMRLDAVNFTPSDMAELEKEAELYIDAGQFLQALSFDRLLRSEVITKELITLPSADYSFNRNLLKSVQKDADRFAALVKVVLRACYISQGAWQDNFVTLVDLLYAEENAGQRSQLIDAIEQDGVFCCNLLCESFANLKKWSPAQRRAAIEKKLESCRAGPGSL
jgi:hypothetical protein